ncbi:MAG: Lrp/AsnC family transcriptional regulator [Fluviicola sp.]|nr:Lrp/AsnC family transcriptional regulator [Fluviicola sp.]
MDEKLDEIDFAILELLKEDAKQGNKVIAEQVGLSVTPTYERIKTMERVGVIEGYTVRLDRSKIGKNLQVFCQVSLKEHNLELLEVFEKEVVALEEVASCYHIAGNYDYTLLIEVLDMEEYENFLRYKLACIPYIGNVQSSFVMSAIK